MTGREIFARDDHPTIDLNLMKNQSTCLNASIINYDANINLSNQYEMRRDDLKKFATLSCANVEYNYLLQLTLTV
jgi:hypothetical protein